MNKPDKCPHCGSAFEPYGSFWCGSKWASDSGKIYQSILCIERTALKSERSARQKAEEELTKAREKLEVAAKLIGGMRPHLRHSNPCNEQKCVCGLRSVIHEAKNFLKAPKL